MLAGWSLFEFKNILGSHWTKGSIATVRSRVLSISVAIIITANTIITSDEIRTGKVIGTTIIVGIWIYLDDEFLESIRTN